MNSFCSTIYIADLKNLRVVTEDVRGHLEWRNVDDINVWVFRSKDSTDLRVLSLQELVHRDTLCLFYRERVDMDLDALPGLYCRPLLSEFFHHLLPHEKGLVSELIHTLFGMFLKLIQSEAALDDRSFGHQKL